MQKSVDLIRERILIATTLNMHPSQGRL